MMTDVDDVVMGLKCCRNWENLRGILPECAECPFADEEEKTCEDMKKQIDAAAADFMRRLRRNQRILSAEEFQTLKGQATHGDIDGACKRLDRLIMERG